MYVFLLDVAAVGVRVDVARECFNMILLFNKGVIISFS
jgi:hypothetical protein